MADAYDAGGPFVSDPSTIRNGGAPEPVFTTEQWAILRRDLESRG